MFSQKLIASGCCSIIALSLMVLSPLNLADVAFTPPAQLQMVDGYGKIPLHFEQNMGQTGRDVKFIARGDGYAMALRENGAVLSTPGSSLRLGFASANPTPRVRAEQQLEGKTNYLLGNDRRDWKTDIPNFERVRYQDIYNGIDLVFYGNQQSLEYDFVIQPNISADQIALDFSGPDESVIGENGDLTLTSGSNVFRQRKPVAYQEISGERREVDVAYVLQDQETETQGRRVGFKIGEYDRRYSLVIDPILSFSTFLGGDSETLGTSIAVDQDGNAYVAGYTNSTTGFPLVNPFQGQNPGGNAAFVTKLNSTGTSFIYSTYLTGPTFTNSAASSIAVDSSGSAYVAGITQSCNFPTTAESFMSVVPNCGGNFKGFVVKMNPAGNGLAYGTYLSSPDFLFNGELKGIALDSSNNAYITGWTQTATFPTTTGAFKTTLTANTQNAFVSKLNSSGSALVYSTFVGIGTPVPNTDPYDQANAIAVDSSGNAYITGKTLSQNFPVTNTAFQTFPRSRQDAFVTKLNTDGTGLVYSTYLGGNGDEIGQAIDLDADGNAFVTGSFDGTNSFPFTPGAFRNGAGENCCASVQNAFLTKINSTGTSLVYSTSLGTERQAMGGTGVAVDSDGSAYVVGGQGIGAAYAVNAIQPISHNNDVFILKMNPAGTGLTYSTNFGGSTGNSIGAAIAVDLAGAAYITGQTLANDFPVSAGAAQAVKSAPGSYSSFAAKIATLPSDCPAIVLEPQPLPPVVSTFAYNQQLIATGGTAPYTFSQAPGFGSNNLPAGLTLSSDGIISGTPTNTDFRSYIVTIQALDGNGCIGIRTFNLEFVESISPLQVSITGRTAVLRGRQNRYLIESTNNSGADLYNIPLYIRFPDYLLVNGATVVNSGEAEQCVSIPRLPKRSSIVLPFIVTVPDQPQYANIRFEIAARLGHSFDGSDGCGQSVTQSTSDGGVGVDVVGAFDPNDKVGPSGAGSARFVTADKPFDYIIHFENLPTATAPAHTIVVTDQLDATKFDLTTFAFSEITLGSQAFSPQNNRTSFTKDFDLRPANNIIARLGANFDTSTGLISWRLESIDPITGQPTDEPLAGILPPNTAPPNGEGSVSFRVNLKPNLATGTGIDNEARIVFDTNAPIDTPVWSNMVDISAPTSAVRSLPQFSASTFSLIWSGTDEGSGTGKFDIYVSDNGAPFTLFRDDSIATSTVFIGEIGHTYSFYSIAKDLVGNQEAAKTTAEATTTVDRASVPITVSGRVLTPDGRGINGATVIMFDSDNVQHRVRTNSFGNYRVDAVLTGQTYLLTASARRYAFENQSIQPAADLTNIDFVGIE